MGLLARILSKASEPSPELDAIVAVAATESAGFGHNYIGTEHVLCALVQTSDAGLIRIFRLFGLRLANLRESVLSVAKGGPHHASGVVRPRTPRLRHILQLASDNLRAGKRLTPSQSLLLGILQEGNGVAIRALSSLSVNLARMRQELETANQLPDPTSPPVTPPAGAGGAPSVAADH